MCLVGRLVTRTKSWIATRLQKKHTAFVNNHPPTTGVEQKDTTNQLRESNNKQQELVWNWHSNVPKESKVQGKLIECRRLQVRNSWPKDIWGGCIFGLFVTMFTLPAFFIDGILSSLEYKYYYRKKIDFCFYFEIFWMMVGQSKVGKFLSGCRQHLSLLKLFQQGKL